MSFTIDNPYTRQTPQHVPQIHEVDGRRFETTGEHRLAKKGEYVLGLFGVAIVNNDTSAKLPILREIRGA